MPTHSIPIVSNLSTSFWYPNRGRHALEIIPVAQQSRSEVLAMKRAIHFLLTFSCAAILCASASAQVQTTSAVSGTVTDSSGAVMPGVNITVRNEDTGAVRETVTNDAGHYSVQALRPGKYSITAALPGFKTAVVKDREVQVSIPASV